MSLKTIYIQLARMPGHPEGDSGHSYDFRAPLDAFGYLDKAAWPRVKELCTVNRIDDGFVVESGLLILTGGNHWAFSYAPGPDDDEEVFKLASHRIVPGEYITVTEHDGQARTFHIVSVHDWNARTARTVLPSEKPGELPPAVAAATAHEPKSHHSLFGGLIFTITLLGGIALAVRQSYPAIAVAAVVSVLLLVVIFHYALRASGFFGVIFANSVGVYTCLYIVFVSSNFPLADGLSVPAAYLLPLLGFTIGVLSHRDHLRSLAAETPRHRPSAVRGATLWIGPLAAIAIITSFLRIPSWTPVSQDAGLILSMAAVAVIGWGSSRRISLFLLDTGAVFRAFFANAVTLMQPAFALLTCYSLVIILFGSTFTIFDQMSLAPNFAILGEATPMTFPEGLYLSVATLTMVGYGDITPVSSVARLLVSVELICGVILLLFGVEAMLQRGNRS